MTTSTSDNSTQNIDFVSSKMSVNQIIQKRWDQYPWDQYPLPSEFARYEDVLHGLLSDWGVDHDLTQTLAVFPWIRHYSLDLILDFEGLFNEKQKLLLENFWDIQLIGNAKNPGRAFAEKTRKLMRLAYLDVYFVLISLAEHLAYLKISSSHEVTEETANVYLNLLKMFGFWGIRREQIEEGTKKLDFYEYLRMENQIQERQALYTEAEINFKQQISEAAQRAGIDLNAIAFRQPRPGRVLHKSQERRIPVTEQLRSATVDLITQSDTDCYNLLYLVHQIGVPIRGNFIDYITKPQFNGYSGLHTKIIFKDIPSGLTIEVRIKTQEMEDLNMNGFIYSKNKPNLTQRKNGKRWWDVPSENKELVQFIAKNEIGTLDETSKDIYVFSPSGEAHQIPKKFRAIDFAYHLHTEVGHHAQSILINGLPANHDSNLRNGDLIKINYNPHFPGPLPEWLVIATSSKAKREIRANIAELAIQQTASRTTLNKHLNSLKEESGLMIPAPVLEKHLLSIADRLGYDNIHRLFIDLDRKQSPKHFRSMSIDRLLCHILEMEFSKYLLFNNGDRVIAPENGDVSAIKTPKVRFCPKCKPVPENKVALQVKRTRRGKAYYTLHRSQPIKDKYFGLPRSTSKTCLDKIKASSKNELLHNLGWANIAVQRKLFQLTIIAHDSSALLRAVCKPIWEDDRVSLSGINATADHDGSAYISLIIECDSKEQAMQMNKLIEALDEVTMSTLSPIATETNLSFQRQHRIQINPYSTGAPVEDISLFFGREVEKKQFEEYLSAKESNRLIVIHGHRRSGKTSFAQHLKFHLLNGRPYITVIADLQLFGSRDIINLYSELAHEIYTEFSDLKIDLALPSPEKFQANAYRTFESFVLQAQRATKKRIILVIDEFNLLAEEMISNTNDNQSQFFHQLRGMIMSPRFKNLIFAPIVHTSVYKLGLTNKDVNGFYALAKFIDIRSLDNDAATSLITKPMDGYIKFDSKVVNRLVAGTAGNPYLINLLCYAIVELLYNDNRSIARIEDLDIAYTRSLSNNALTHFNFIIRHIAETQNGVDLVKQIAQLQKDQLDWVSISNLKNHHLPDTKIAIDRLVNTNVIESRNNFISLRLSCGYFRDWVCAQTNRFEEAVKNIHGQN
ncbi:MAG: TGS domain-containing protein [Anaerolineae bacterium]